MNISASAAEIGFGPFRLDPGTPRLWKGNDAIAIQPRPLSVLCFLAQRPGQVVGRDELIRTLWAGTYVTRAVLKVAVRAVREALGDDADAPRYVETVGREGYRFVVGGRATSAPAAGPSLAPDAMVGRDRVLALLRERLGRAGGGARQLVFVTGEGGIGKTTLLERFLADVERERTAWVARGQCLEQYGGGEAYLPFLEALGRLARADAAGEVAAVLRRHAPTWVPQLPALAADDPARGRGGHATTTLPARMLREMADALEVLTAERALVLVLEDLQWSDPSTVDLIAYVARRRQPACLMLIGTLRPAEVIVHEHTLRGVKQELQAAGLCEEVALEPLSLADVRAYVEARFGLTAEDELQRLAARVHERTDGNALFMVNMANDLVAQEALIWRDGRWHVQPSLRQATSAIPVGLRELIVRRLQRLEPATRTALEVASVMGIEFVVGAVALTLDEDPDTIDDRFETLAAQGTLIADAGVAESPDGTLTGRYRFLHGLYQHVLYEGIGAARRVRLHRAIGLATELASAGRAEGRAAELAMHFERGHDHARALEYREIAGAAALERHAAHEAAGHFAEALNALAHRPRSEPTERELGLVVSHARLLMAIRGFAAPETEHAFARAQALCDALPDNAGIFPVLRGILSYHHVRAELDDAHRVGELLLRYAARPGRDRALRVQAHYAQGANLFHMGSLDAARDHLEHALRDYDPAAHDTHMRVYGGYDPGVACSMWLGWTLSLLGRLEEGAARGREGLTLARQLGDPFSLAWACQAEGVSQQVFGDWIASETASAESARLAEEHGFPHVLGMAMANRGWALVMQGKPAAGIPILRRGVATVDATGAALVRPQYLGMLAAADAIEGHPETAAARFDEALSTAARTRERLYEAALLIGKSHLLAGTGGPAEDCLRRALEVARRQNARVLELRAAVALARHCRKRGRTDEARELLAGAHAWFARVPPAAPEIVAARRVLAELGSVA